ncbi:MAG: ABC transporter substrate-binding protein [Chloroflexi bacterium]|nr:ABC transporter substrate-binding protein [Chloroflexota bacterium]
MCILLSACVGSTKPTIKIGLIGPFEGRYREVGQEVIYAVRLAVRQANASGGVGGYTVELMAFDDGGDPAQAAEQARKLSTDSQVMGVIGNWLDATTLAAAPVLAQSGIPFLATTAAPDLDPAAFRMWPTESALRAAVPTALYCESNCSSLETLDWFAAHCQPATTPCAGPPLWGLNQFPRLVGSTAEGVWVAAPAPLPADSGDPLRPPPAPGRRFGASTSFRASLAPRLRAFGWRSRPPAPPMLATPASLPNTAKYRRGSRRDSSPCWLTTQPESFSTPLTVMPVRIPRPLAPGWPRRWRKHISPASAAPSRLTPPASGPRPKVMRTGGTTGD